MRITEITQSHGQPLTEAPVGGLRQMGRKLGTKALSAIGAKQAAAHMAGKIDQGEIANKLFYKFVNYLGRDNGKKLNDVTGDYLGDFLRNQGYYTDIHGEDVLSKKDIENQMLKATSVSSPRGRPMGHTDSYGYPKSYDYTRRGYGRYPNQQYDEYPSSDIYGYPHPQQSGRRKGSDPFANQHATPPVTGAAPSTGTASSTNRRGDRQTTHTTPSSATQPASTASTGTAQPVGTASSAKRRGVRPIKTSDLVAKVNNNIGTQQPTATGGNATVATPKRVYGKDITDNQLNALASNTRTPKETIISMIDANDSISDLAKRVRYGTPPADTGKGISDTGKQSSSDSTNQASGNSQSANTQLTAKTSDANKKALQVATHWSDFIRSGEELGPDMRKELKSDYKNLDDTIHPDIRNRFTQIYNYLMRQQPASKKPNTVDDAAADDYTENPNNQSRKESPTTKSNSIQSIDRMSGMNDMDPSIARGYLKNWNDFINSGKEISPRMRHAIDSGYKQLDDKTHPDVRKLIATMYNDMMRLSPTSKEPTTVDDAAVDDAAVDYAQDPNNRSRKDPAVNFDNDIDYAQDPNNRARNEPPATNSASIPVPVATHRLKSTNPADLTTRVDKAVNQSGQLIRNFGVPGQNPSAFPAIGASGVSTTSTPDNSATTDIPKKQVRKKQVKKTDDTATPTYGVNIKDRDITRIASAYDIPEDAVKKIIRDEDTVDDLVGKVSRRKELEMNKKTRLKPGSVGSKEHPPTDDDGYSDDD